MTSARTRRLPGAVRRRSRAAEMAKGGFATTRNGRRGNRASAPSARTTITSSRANSRRSSSDRLGCSSNAMTRAPRCTRWRVIAPEPAPMSRTRSPRETPALSTSRSAHLLSSRCHPHRVRCSDTADHREHCHATTIRSRIPVGQSFVKMATYGSLRVDPMIPSWCHPVSRRTLCMSRGDT